MRLDIESNSTKGALRLHYKRTEADTAACGVTATPKRVPVLATTELERVTCRKCLTVASGWRLVPATGINAPRWPKECAPFTVDIRRGGRVLLVDAKGSAWADFADEEEAIRVAAVLNAGLV